MTVEELRERRTELELEILGMLDDFQRATGVGVAEVHVNVTDLRSGGSPQRYTVGLTLALDL